MKASFVTLLKIIGVCKPIDPVVSFAYDETSKFNQYYFMSTEGHHIPATVEREVPSAPASFQGSAEIERLNKHADLLQLPERLSPDAVPSQIAAFREKIRAKI